MTTHYQHGEADAYLAKYPALRKWILQCVACQRQGYRSDLPEQIGPGVAAQNLLLYFRPITLDENGLCEERHVAIQKIKAI